MNWFWDWAQLEHNHCNAEISFFECGKWDAQGSRTGTANHSSHRRLGRCICNCHNRSMNRQMFCRMTTNTSTTKTFSLVWSIVRCLSLLTTWHESFAKWQFLLGIILHIDRLLLLPTSQKPLSHLRQGKDAPKRCWRISISIVYTGPLLILLTLWTLWYINVFLTYCHVVFEIPVLGMLTYPSILEIILTINNHVARMDAIIGRRGGIPFPIFGIVHVGSITWKMLKIRFGVNHTAERRRTIPRHRNRNDKKMMTCWYETVQDYWVRELWFSYRK